MQQTKVASRIARWLSGIKGLQRPRRPGDAAFVKAFTFNVFSMYPIMPFLAETPRLLAGSQDQPFGIEPRRTLRRRVHGRDAA